jgi:hypothetical protein
VVYDVPFEGRPRAADFSSITVRGSAPWADYLRTRRQVDDGALTIILSLRSLGAAERRLVVNWGSKHANSLLLVEPREPACDLTNPGDPAARELADLLAVTDPPDAGAPAGWTRHTALGDFLLECFGRWVYWPSPGLDCQPEEVVLDLRRPSDTVALKLLSELPHRFPQELFDRSMAFLHFWERELFGGPVPRARSVFRTRLGLPVLHDPYCADRALRRLVNEGKVSVVGPTRVPRLSFGFGSPVPSAMSDEEFENLVML